ncbi:hypothetical protein AAVH_30402, partial [Aphelenchoides avenae]
ASPSSEEKKNEGRNQQDASTPPRAVKSDAGSQVFNTVLYYAFFVFCLLWSPLAAGFLFVPPVWMTYDFYRMFFK